jgi:hypothetical protein
MQTPMPGSGQQRDPQDEPTQGAGKGQPNEKPNPTGAGGQPEKNEPTDPEAKDGSGNKPNEKTDDSAKGGTGDKKGEKPRDADKPGGGKGEPRRDPQAKADALAQQAERNTETGKTVVDILQSILKSTDPGDKDVIAKVDELLKDQKLDETVSRMANLSEQLRDGRFGDAKVLAADSADRWEAAALRLATVFRQLSAPKLEELLNAEQKLQDLRDRLDKLENERAVVQWITDAGKLMDQLDKLKVGDKLREQLEELLRQAGWSEELERFRLRGGGWVLANRGYYDAPAGYRPVLVNLTQEVQAHIQELILGDLLAGQDEAAPPQYEQLVERYYQVLATGSLRKQPAMPKPTKDAP